MQGDALTHVVFDSVRASDGRISAQHGLGQSERNVIADYEDPLDITSMQAVKRS